MHSDDIIIFLDEHETEQKSGGGGETLPPPWILLVVDDDEEVHAVTRIALGDFRFKGRPLRIESCYSAREAFAYLSRHRDVACALVDVVMEDEQAGLTLVRRIRTELENSRLRIILRTGQPGYAPEIDIIQSYDINDYKAKTELTVTRLVSSVITALRSYDQIATIEDHKRGLEMVIRASADLFRERNMRDFAAGVVTLLAAQMGVAPEGVLCASLEDTEPVVVAGAGRFSGCVCKPLSRIGDGVIEQAVSRALRERRHLHLPDCTVFYLESATAKPAAVYVQGSGLDVDRQGYLLRLFCMNIALGFETAQLFGQLESTAYIDALTRLLNRAGFVKAIGPAPLGPAVSGFHSHAAAPPLVVAVLDIDQFYAITGQLGPAIGDDLLRAVAARLGEAFPDALAIARLSSDQFALALPQAAAESLAGRVGEAFERPLAAGTLEVTIGMTGGFSDLAATRRRDGETLLREAVRAMKEAKGRGRGQLLPFLPELDGHNARHVFLMSDLRHAIKDDEILLYFQPKVDMRDGAGCGVEALVRWQSAKFGLLGPGAFVPVAEVSGLILPLGRRIFELGLRQYRLWRRQGLNIPVAVNVSAVQVQQADFLRMVDEVLDDLGIAADGIEIEITETSLLGDGQRVYSHLAGLRERGFGLALDDFGTGYSSLSHLHRMPLTALKIDQRFVASLDEPGRSQLLVEAMVGVARAMAIKVVAEGIETEAQAAKLREMGVDIGQGYLFGRPMPAEQLVAWWCSNPRSRLAPGAAPAMNGQASCRMD